MTERNLTYADVVHKMTDLKALAQPVAPGEKAGEYTSYDRRSQYDQATDSYIHWDANDDWGTTFDYTEDGGAILADLTGPGAIVRLWSAQPESGHVKIFIDGSSTPAVDMAFSDYFGGAFPFHLSHISYDAARGKNCYLPIPYNTSCKVVAYDNWGRYFHVGYIIFPGDTTVEPFSLPLSSENEKALMEAEGILKGLAEAGAPCAEGKTVTVPAHGSAILLETEDAGAITRIAVKLEGMKAPGDDWNALSQLAIAAYWDGEIETAIHTTLGGFFGSICGLHPYHSLPMGVLEDGTMYCNWYMPYSDGAKLLLQNDGEAAYTVTYTVSAMQMDKVETDGLLRFHAKWNQLCDPDTDSDRWPDAEFLSVEGSGRFVGTSLHVYKEMGTGDPANHPDWWWGEGDEKFFVDDEKFPSWFGTGSEDYFGYAWGSWYPFAYPYHAQPFTNGGMWGIGNRLNNRFHIIDNVPFLQSFVAYLEKYHRDGYANQVVTNYWYMKKGEDDGYGEVSLEERTAYYGLPYPEPETFYEGEAMKIIECSGMQKAEVQDMYPFHGFWSDGNQLLFMAEKNGYLKLYVNVPVTGNYDVVARFTLAGDYGIASHFIDGVSLGEPVDLYHDGVVRSKRIPIGKDIFLTEGLHVLEVRMLDKNEKSTGYFYGLDCLELKSEMI